MEKIDITTKIFSSLDDFFIFVANESKIEVQESDFDDIHSFIKMIYEHSTHPNDGYSDDGSGRKNWNKVLNLLRNDLIVERVDVLFNKYYDLFDEEEKLFLLEEYIDLETINFIKNNLPLLYK